MCEQSCRQTRARDGDGSFNANRYGPSRSRLRRDKVADEGQRKRRKCLMCREPFISAHFGERVCGSCKETAAWKDGIRSPSIEVPSTGRQVQKRHSGYS